MKPALRLAWREIARHKLRSLIGLLIIALPVVILSAVAGYISLWISHERDSELQAIVYSPQQGNVHQNPVFDYPLVSDGPSSSDFSLLTEEKLASIVAPNRLEPVHNVFAFISLNEDQPTRSVVFQQFDVASHPALTRLLAGTAPQYGEIALALDDVQALNAKVGSQITTHIRGERQTVRLSGITLDFSYAGKGTFETPSTYNSTGADPAWLVFGDRPVSWEKVKQINEHGSGVDSTWVRDNPPPVNELYPDMGGSESGDIFVMIYSVIMAALLVVFVLILMVTPVFTIAAQRMRRELGLIVLNGGERRHIRAVVLTHGLILGVLGGVLGSVMGMVLLGARVGWFVLSIPRAYCATLGVAGVGLIFGVLAALVPAWQASRLTPIRAAQNRFPLYASEACQNAGGVYAGVRRTRTVVFLSLFIVGLAAVTAIGVLWNHVEWLGNKWFVLSLSTPPAMIVMVVGAIGLVPTVLELIAARLPVRGLLKIAARDTLRSSHRTVPAIGALVGVVIGATPILTGISVMAGSMRQSLQESPWPVGSAELLMLDDGDDENQMDEKIALDSATRTVRNMLGSSDVADMYWSDEENSYLLVHDLAADCSCEKSCFVLKKESSAAPASGAPATSGTVTSANGEANLGGEVNELAPGTELVSVPLAEDSAEGGTDNTEGMEDTDSWASTEERPASEKCATWKNKKDIYISLGYQILDIHSADALTKIHKYLGDKPLDEEVAAQFQKSGAILVPKGMFSQQAFSQENENELPHLTIVFSGPSSYYPVEDFGLRVATSMSVPVVEVPGLYEVVIPLNKAEQWNMHPNIAQRVIIPEEIPTPLQAAAISRAIAPYDSVLSVYVNQLSPVNAYGVPALVVFIVLIFFCFVLFVMAIAADDMRSDLATLYAIGASERDLRRFSLLQGLLIGAVAVALGIPTGIAAMIPFDFFGLHDIEQLRHWPWFWLVFLALAIPLVSAASAALTRPRKLTLTRRFE